MAKRTYDDLKDYFNNPSKRKKKKTSRFTRKTKFTIIGIFLLILVAFYFYIVSGLPSLEQLENPKPQLASTVYSSDGVVLGQYFIENRTETNLDSLPKFVA